ncbi:MAG: phosphonate metabolism protein/1,5-bisphosphokinase (PRPP-forming) PhnN [Woeseiaceae bacterium]
MAKLFYIIGGSGAGKDSLIDYIRKHISDHAKVEIIRRYITRSSNAGGENHIALTEEEFLKYRDNEHFSMCWFSHDTYYGIGTEIDCLLSKNISVVMNGSRAYLSEAARKYPGIIPVLISVDPLILSERLYSRGRENDAEIQKRVAQAVKLENSVQHPNLRIVDNNNLLENAGQQLLNIITHRCSDKCA